MKTAGSIEFAVFKYFLESFVKSVDKVKTKTYNYIIKLIKGDEKNETK